MHKRSIMLRAICVVAAVCLGALAPGAASASAAAAEPAKSLDAPNWVYNATSLGIGMIRWWDGDYDMGLYDAVLPSKKYTHIAFGWNEARGVYIGPGYRAQIHNFDTGAVSNYGCTTTGHLIHLREGDNYEVRNVSRC